MWTLIILGALIVVLYVACMKPYNYWKKKGVPHIKPIPLFGNMAPMALRARAMAHLVQDLYYTYPEQRYMGFHQFLLPTLLIRDPELIKKVAVKDFDCFCDHRELTPDSADPMWGKTLFGLKGDRWYDMRSTLSPSFTSSKMKMMFGLMKNCAKQFTDHFEQQGGMVTVEMKDAITRYTNDVIATTAFGITCNSLKNPDNEFYMMAKDAFNFTGLRALTFLLSAISLKLNKLFNLPIFNESVTKFFRKIIEETLKIRREKGIVRPDMLHLLMQAQQGRLKEEEQASKTVDSGFAVVHESSTAKQSKRQKVVITEEDITAQCLIFFGAGFDTTSTFICYISYELAINPDVQDKLRKELEETLDECGAELRYEDLMGMKYLDMVVSEALRKWPPALATDRLSVKPYTIEPELEGEQPITIDAGTTIWIPQYALHRDPKYYPNPDKFDPERFSDENKHKIKPFTYIPFGVGPRSCIGSRLALLEGKLLTAEILRKFEIVPVEKTQIPIEIEKGGIFPLPKDGFWLGLKPRSNVI